MNTVQKIFRIVLFVLFLFHSFEIKRGNERFSATKTQLEINQHEDSGKDCAHKNLQQQHHCLLCSTSNRNVLLVNIFSSDNLNSTFVEFLTSSENPSQLSFKLLKNLRAPPIV